MTNNIKYFILGIGSILTILPSSSYIKSSRKGFAKDFSNLRKDYQKAVVKFNKKVSVYVQE